MTVTVKPNFGEDRLSLPSAEKGTLISVRIFWNSDRESQSSQIGHDPEKVYELTHCQTEDQLAFLKPMAYQKYLCYSSS